MSPLQWCGVRKSTVPVVHSMIMGLRIGRCFVLLFIHHNELIVSHDGTSQQTKNMEYSIRILPIIWLKTINFHNSMRFSFLFFFALSRAPFPKKKGNLNGIQPVYSRLCNNFIKILIKFHVLCDHFFREFC